MDGKWKPGCPLLEWEITDKYGRNDSCGAGLEPETLEVMVSLMSIQMDMWK